MGIIKPQEKKRQATGSNTDSTAHNQTLKQQKQLNGRSYDILISTNTEC
jgi:hypothetical protein